MSRTLLALVFMPIVIWLSNGCKKEEVDSDVHSVIGISSGALTGYLQSAPNISKFTTWLSSFQVTGKQSSDKNLNFAEIARPEDGKNFKTPILSFASKEIDRLENFIALLEKKSKSEEDNKLIKSYLMVETEEVFDILNVVLDKDYIPKEKSSTRIEKINDFALFLKLTDNDISLEFTKFILGELFKKENLPEIINNLNRESNAGRPSEKEAYYNALLNAHTATLGSRTNIDLMVDALSGLKALKAYLEGQSISYASEGYSFSETKITGVPAAFIHFHQTFRKKTVERKSISGAPNIPTMAGKKDDKSKLQGDEGTQSKMNNGSYFPGLSNQSGIINFNQLVNSYYINTNMNSLQISSHNYQQISKHRNYKSPINCKKQGLDSEGLVYCNLYGAYSNVPVGKNAQTSSFGSYLNLNEEQCEIPEYSYALVQYNHSPVQNQGREGARVDS